MSNVFNFPKAPKPQRLALDLRRVSAGLFGALAWLRAAFRGLLFLVLYWLRAPVHMVCNLIAGPALLAFLAGLWIAHHEPKYQAMVWGLGAVSFAAFVARWAYDALLARLAPEDVLLTL